MLRRLILAPTILVLTASCSQQAPPAPEGVGGGAPTIEPATIPNSEVRLLKSQFVNQEFRIYVAKPTRWGVTDSAGTKYPVIYALDANGEFGTVAEVVRMAAFGPGEMPTAIVVGIGYPVAGMAETLNLRTRDYTPTRDTAFAGFAAGLWGNGVAPTPGGAEAFLKFIREELKPFIEKNYPADPADATLIGHSFGGLFAAYALLRQPEAFQRYVIASPSLWWDRKILFEYEKQYAAEHKDLAAKVFLSVGGLENTVELKKSFANFPPAMLAPMTAYYDRAGYPEMVELLGPFAKALAGRRYPSLRVTSYVFPGETHSSVMPMIASRGLRVVFRRDDLP